MSKLHNITTSLAAVLLLIISALSLQSCVVEVVDHPIPVHELVGEWRMIEESGVPVDSRYSESYAFYEDYTGTYSYYDRLGRIWYEDFYWETNQRGTLYINYVNQAMGSAFCYYDLDGNYAYFSDDPRFHYYNTYIRIR